MKEEKIQTDTLVIFVLTCVSSFKRVNYSKVVAQVFDGFLISWSPRPTYTLPAPTLCLILFVKGWVLFSVFPVSLTSSVLKSLRFKFCYGLRFDTVCPPCSAISGYDTEGVLLISARLSTDTVSTLRKAYKVLITLLNQHSVEVLNMKHVCPCTK